MREFEFEQRRVNGIKCWHGLAWNRHGENLAAKAMHRDVGSASRAPDPREDEDDAPPF